MPTPTAQLPRQITTVDFAGHRALQLRTRHGTAIVAWHGAQVLSWVPAGEREVFWLSPASLPEPAAIRGGVPVCWPWFAKQGQRTDAVQHGPVRNLRWQLCNVAQGSDEEITLSMEPITQAKAARHEALADGVPAGLRVRMTLTLSHTLQQTLHTENLGAAPFELSQALHSYYAVSHAPRVSIEGLQGLRYTDRLRALAQDSQDQPFKLDRACDRTYVHPPATLAPQSQRYTLLDPDWQRRIQIDVTGSRSVVVWNPGHQTARQMVDVPDDAWPGFFCIEAANAGPDVIWLDAGAKHQLTQTLRVLGSAVQPVGLAR